MEKLDISRLKNIKIQYRIVFISVFIFGLLAHGMGIFNKYSFHDEVYYLFGEGATFESGRWMLGILGAAARAIYKDTLISIPVFQSAVSFCLIAASAVILVKFLEIENNTVCALIGGLMVVFPTITGLFSYMFTFTYYMIALLLAVISGWLMIRAKKWYGVLGGIVLAVCSVGIYQAFVPVIFCVMLFGLIQEAAFSDEYRTASFIRKSLLALLYIVAFLGLYLAVNKLFLSILHIKLTDYKAIDTMGMGSYLTYRRRFTRMIYDYLGIYPVFINSIYPNRILDLRHIIIALSFALVVIQALRVGKKDILRGVALVGFFFVFLVAANFIMVMVDPLEVHMLMVYGQAMPFILFAWLMEKVTLPRPKLEQAVKSLCVFLLLAVVVLYSRFDNKCHLRVEFRKAQSASYCTTLITRIKSVDGYSDKMPVVYVNVNKGGIRDATIYDFDEFGEMEVIGMYGNVLNPLEMFSYKEYLKTWHSFAPETLSDEDYVNRPEVIAMPSYPDSGSIQILDGVIVVKLADNDDCGIGGRVN